MIVYKYNNKTYNNLYSLRQDNPNLVFSDDEDSLKLIGIEKEEVPDEIPSLNELKARKYNELITKSSNLENKIVNTDIYFTSSLGYKFNGDVKSVNNLSVTINNLNQPFSTEKTKFYRDYDNQFRELTLEQLQTVFYELGLNSENLYKQKWQFEEMIKNAKSKEELENINIKFEMLDFSKNS